MDKCYVKEKDDWIEAEFMGVFQYSRVIEPSPMIGGHPGGVIANPLAVVKVNGELKEVKVSNVKFNN